MAEKIVVGPLPKGLRNDITPFNVDNVSFPVLQNAYQWRQRVKRKRGTQFLGRLQRNIGTTDGSGNATITINPHPFESGVASFSIGTDVFTDQGGSSPVTMITNSAGTGVLNRTTGVLTITGSQLSTSIIYYPSLPVMGIELLDINPNQLPGTLGFDTTYSYNIPTRSPYTPYDVTFYKNPLVNSNVLPGYTPKASSTPFYWNGEDYQQFYTINYQGALWATNGVDVLPFTGTTIGMQYAGTTTTPPLSTPVRVSATTMTFTVPGNPLVVGDFVFANEFTASAGGNAAALNFQTGYVTAQGNTFTVTFPFANIPAGTYSPGILQYLTNTSSPGLDCLRWYDGDPTANNGNGWVNFAPPLFSGTPNFAPGDLTPAQYYLVGAKVIAPYKDRIIFFGPVVQTSTGSPIYLQDTIVYSQNGTPYYTASFSGSPTSAATVFSPTLAPQNQSSSAPAWFEDITGFGGFITIGLDKPINTVGRNEDVLIVGLRNYQTRLVYTGNDLNPFLFYVINSEYGSDCTFSTVTMDEGVLTKGNKAYTVTAQTNTTRIDQEIPDEAFEVNLTTNGNERFTAQRDFISEWIYFTYPANNINYKYPNTTLQFNYRDNSWALFIESYTNYGPFTPTSGYTWLTIPWSWNQWNEPWNAGVTTLGNPLVLGGNQQGFILIRNEGTSEGTSLTIQNISGNTVTSPNHNLNNTDYVILNNCLGSIGQFVNGQIFSVANASTNTFDLNPNIGSGTYQGGGTITRMYIPLIQTRQFPVSWEMGRKTRLGTQRYLLTTTDLGQITILIFLSQNDDFAYNIGPLVPSTPATNIINGTLIYSTLLYTCPEGTNLGLTPSNINLNLVTANSQNQTWHRMNTSLLGDTVQVGITLSDAQMRQFTPTIQSFSITGITNAYPAVITTANSLGTGNMVQITGVQGMTQINQIGNQVYQVISANSTSATINIDTTAFSFYTMGGTITVMEMPNQFEEIELHSMILEVSPSQMLV